MSKRLLSILLVAFLCFTQAYGAEAATAKAGASCSKLKATSVVNGKKFTCIKSGKKLVWDKGITVPISADQIAKSARVADIRKAFDAIAVIAKSTSIQATNLKIVSSPEVKQDSIKNIEARYSFVASFFDAQLSANSPVAIVISTNSEIAWTASEIEKLSNNSFSEWLKNFSKMSLDNPCGPYYNAGSVGKTSDGRILNNYNLFGKSCPAQLPSDENFRTTVEHEWVHNVQNAVSVNLDINQNPLNQNMPCWFREGQAVFYGGVLGYRNDYSGYLKVRNWNMKNGVYGKPLMRTDISQTLIKLDEGYDRFACGIDGGYSIGSLAVEKMILLRGHQGVLAFMKELKKTTYWQEAFEIAYGIDGDQWLSSVGKEIAKEYTDAGLSILPPTIITPTCPLPSNSDQNGITRNRANALVGMTEASAEQCASSLNWGFRIGQRDNEMFALTMDYRTDRVTVLVKLGVVTRVDVG